MKFFWDNLYLTRDERTQKITLIAILLLLVFVKFYIVKFYEPSSIPIDNRILDSIQYVNIVETESKNHTKQSNQKYNATPKDADLPIKKHAQVKVKQKQLLFEFDPNRISRDSMKLLGLSRYAINSLMKYRNKGGKIRSIEQMSKVNGLKPETLDKLTPYIKLYQPKKIASAEKKSKNQDSTSTYKKQFTKKFKQYKKKTPQIFEINTGDTTDFKNLYGIGNVYSNRIIKYRNSLGGFFTVEQINDVWGIEDSLYNAIKPYLKVDATLIKKRNINNMDRDSLNRHPYINWKKAKTILAYKQAHGDYQSMDDFYKLHILEDEFVDTMKYYFKVK